MTKADCPQALVFLLRSTFDLLQLILAQEGPALADDLSNDPPWLRLDSLTQECSSPPRYSQAHAAAQREAAKKKEEERKETEAKREQARLRMLERRKKFVKKTLKEQQADLAEQKVAEEGAKQAGTSGSADVDKNRDAKWCSTTDTPKRATKVVARVGMTRDAGSRGATPSVGAKTATPALSKASNETPSEQPPWKAAGLSKTATKTPTKPWKRDETPSTTGDVIVQAPSPLNLVGSRLRMPTPRLTTPRLTTPRGGPVLTPYATPRVISTSPLRKRKLEFSGENAGAAKDASAVRASTAATIFSPVGGAMPLGAMPRLPPRTTIDEGDDSQEPKSPPSPTGPQPKITEAVDHEDRPLCDEDAGDVFDDAVGLQDGGRFAGGLLMPGVYVAPVGLQGLEQVVFKPRWSSWGVQTSAT